MCRAVVMFVSCFVLAGCTPAPYAPDRATRAYPLSLHRSESVDIQVFRDDTKIELINATAYSYRDFDLWLNQRYVDHVDALPAGESLTLSLWRFYDVRGEVFNAGGFWRTEAATPLRLVEIQAVPDESLVGLITFLEE